MRYRICRPTLSTRWPCRCSTPRVWDRRQPSWWWPTKEVSVQVFKCPSAECRVPMNMQNSSHAHIINDACHIVHRSDSSDWHPKDGHKSISFSTDYFSHIAVPQNSKYYGLLTCQSSDQPAKARTDTARNLYTSFIRIPCHIVQIQLKMQIPGSVRNKFCLCVQF